MFEISADSEHVLVGHRLHLRALFLPAHNIDLPWAKVGVFKKGLFEETEEQFPRNQVIAKAMFSGDQVCRWDREWCQSKAYTM